MSVADPSSSLKWAAHSSFICDVQQLHAVGGVPELSTASAHAAKRYLRHEDIGSKF